MNKIILPRSLFDLQLEPYATNHKDSLMNITLRTNDAFFDYDTKNNHRPYLEFKATICAIDNMVIPIGTREDVRLIYQFTNSEISILARIGFYNSNYSINIESLKSLDFTLKRPVHTFNIGEHTLYELPFNLDGSPIIMNKPQDGYGSIMGLFPQAMDDDGITYTTFASASDFLLEDVTAIDSSVIEEKTAAKTAFITRHIESTNEAGTNKMSSLISTRLAEISDFTKEFAKLNESNEYEDISAEPQTEPVDEPTFEEPVDDTPDWIGTYNDSSSSDDELPE